MQAEHDVVVVGAGFAGLYAVHKLRDELGLAVQGFDAAGGPGGTWWWNRYPGARCDFESVHYSYSFSDDLQRGWEWTERFAAQPEILAYLEYVAERLDVRRAFRFSTRVTSVVWDEATSRWTVGTDDGATCTARFVVAAGGNLAVPKQLDFPGLGDFRGEVYATSSWPHEGVDLTGRRVGVIGTGSTGIQVIPEIARQAAHLTVFQRTANFAAPLRNAPVEPEQRRWLADNHEQVRAGSRDTFLGVPYDAPQPSALAATPEERRATYDRYWEAGGFRLVASTYQDLLFDKAANDTVADYIRDRIRERVQDPAVAELLCPTDHPYATKRAPFETDYYETYNRGNVTLVDLRRAPIQTLTPDGIRTADGGEHELDVLVLATGFDAVTGPLKQMGIVGRDGVKLEDKWAGGPETYLGIATNGFPNLFTITGPQSAIALYNNPLAIEDHVELMTAMVEHVLTTAAGTIEASREAELKWLELTTGILHLTLLPQANSWYMGANVPGKPRATFVYAGGAPLYRATCAEVAATGWSGFHVGGAPTRVPPMVQLDPAVAMVLGALLQQGAKPLEECTLEETRGLVESFTLLQAPRRELREVVETTYPGPGGDRPARIYVPDVHDADGPLPVLVFLHPGGWIAGSLEVADEPCRTLAHDLGAIVVSPSYRLAPEAPFPAATDDTYAALRWVADTIGEHGGDTGRIAIAGESAGGQLAAVAAQRARDEDGPALVAQVLLYPPIDRDAVTASREEFAAGPFLSVAAADGMWAAYLADNPAAAISPLASPARAASLAGLPDALVLSMGCDPTRDEAEDYGNALAAAGVPTVVRRIDGLIHGVLNMSAFVPRSRELYDEIAAFLAPRFERDAAAAGAGSAAGTAPGGSTAG
ncbi:MAG: putative flavoprotein involved in transport [Solirubrobacterales bacterium]|nr:putative flavoprotein involved in transport [Solirubrobacterales bacterium]